MLFLIISILCSVTVSIMLKLAKRYKINVLEAVTWNYFFAILLGLFFFKPEITDLVNLQPDPVYYALGVLLPLVFWFLAASVKSIGIAKTDVAQRLSLILSLAAAYFLFGDQFSVAKVAGLVIGLLAVVLLLNKQNSSKNNASNWIYPVVVFAGFGLIDIMFKKVAQMRAIPYTSSLIYIFALAFIVSLLAILYTFFVNHKKLQLINFLCGGILGFFNFFNILFYMKAHQAMADHPSTVFAAMNLGVIITGCLAGVLIFKEKLSSSNIVGLMLAIVAISLITIAQVYAI
ncbi:MAG: DMT family transporter [Bacteroidota bacterium]